MIRYVPSTVAEVLSERLWGLARPPQVRGVKDTQRMFSHFTATDGSGWLVVDTEFDIPVHPEAELNGIADILQPWIDSGNLPSDTNAQLAAYVESMRGQRMTPWNAFPQLFKDMSKTREEMEALGLIPVVTMP